MDVFLFLLAWTQGFLILAWMQGLYFLPRIDRLFNTCLHVDRADPYHIISTYPPFL